MLTSEDLRRILHRINGRGYKAYKDIEGAYKVGFYFLYIDHVQADPFAPPSKLRIRIPQEISGFPPHLFNNRPRRTALEDLLARKFRDAIKRVSKGKRGSGKSGVIYIDAGGQEVLERTAAIVNKDWVEVRVQVGLPAAGRTILACEAEEILLRELPQIVERSLIYRNLDSGEIEEFVNCIENQEFIREKLDELGLIAFVADGAILPRKSGASDLPMPRNRAVPFKSPDSLRICVKLPNPIKTSEGIKDEITGMGIPKGVTLIVGGGFHGKSTLLQALEKCVYPHIPGDGREYVVTCRDTVKIRAEDGRRVEKVDISPFITSLPTGLSTQTFCTDDASGSTSQAANIMEALEVGAKVLLVDEDTSATNFMIRDARMQALVSKENEPITPFVDRVRELFEKFGVSTVLVMGGSGDYFDVADTVIMMKEYVPVDVTEEAKRIAATIKTDRKIEAAEPFSSPADRIPLPDSIDPSRGRKEVKIDVKALDVIRFGRETIDLRHVEQVVDISQTRAIGHAIYLALKRFIDGKKCLREIAELLEKFLDREGLDKLDPFYRPGRHPGNFARPRKYEFIAALNRLRTLKVRQKR